MTTPCRLASLAFVIVLLATAGTAQAACTGGYAQDRETYGFNSSDALYGGPPATAARQHMSELGGKTVRITMERGESQSVLDAAVTSLLECGFDVIPVLIEKRVNGVVPKPNTSVFASWAQQMVGRYMHTSSVVPNGTGITKFEIWNEPNLNENWGGAANPTEYGNFLKAVDLAIDATPNYYRAVYGAPLPVSGGLASPGGAAATAFLNAFLNITNVGLFANGTGAPAFVGVHAYRQHSFGGVIPILDAYRSALDSRGSNGRAAMLMLSEWAIYRGTFTSEDDIANETSTEASRLDANKQRLNLAGWQHYQLRDNLQPPCGAIVCAEDWHYSTGLVRRLSATDETWPIRPAYTALKNYILSHAVYDPDPCASGGCG